MASIDKLYINGEDMQQLYGLYLAWRILSAPAVKTYYLEIPARNGKIDMTEAMGDVFYNNRSLKINMYHPNTEWQSDIESFMSKYHGKQCSISFSNDPNWYWTGRIFVSAYDAKDHSLSVLAEVYPYKFASELTEVSVTVSSLTEQTAETITLENRRMPVTPKVTVSSGSVTLKWNEATETLSDGVYYVDGLSINEGSLNIKVWGTGTVTFSYREGAL